ncbi:MAG: response regulator transcription factor [Mollicutes bacterium]|nr:response regulator transcription factor [Mollicutes bacterium]MDD7264550.1 response regulator transcription factor [bacterium]MDY4979018.1 response regulator transcription factor [Candidatus Onthovivens sp.]
MKKLIYSIEDDKDIAYIIRIALENSGYEVKSFYDEESFINEFNNKKPDLFLLDMMLPKIQGQDLLKIIRSDNTNNDIDIIIISANKLISDKVDGLNLGADDYIEKPFDILELISRVNARFRKNKNVIYNIDGFIINEDKRIITKDSKQYKLTNSEFDILLILLKEKGNIVSRDTLITTLWGNNANYESRTIDMHIKNIRKKLDDQNIIITVHGVGYRINE